MKLLLPTSVPLEPDVAPDVELVLYDPRLPIAEEDVDAEALVVWANTHYQLSDCARRMRSLHWVQSLSAGMDQVLAAGFNPNVVVTSGRSLHDQPVAEHALALLLSAARRLHQLTRAQIAHRWAGELGGVQPLHDTASFRSLRQARVLIWGFGSIALTLAPHLTALGAQVTGVARTAGRRGDYPVISVDDIAGHLPYIDALVMLVPSMTSTRHILDATLLALLPPHAWLVNVGRGSTVDTEALLHAVRTGRLAGASLDVFEDEPLPPNSPLWDEPDIIISPHAAGGRPLGADTLVSENLRALRAGEPLRNVVQR